MPLPLTRYALDRPTSRPLTSTGGALKAVQLVSAGGQNYVLKRYRPDFRSLEDVTAIHDAQAHLRLRGIPVVQVVPNRDGERFTETEDGLWVLYECAPGCHRRGGRDMTPMAAADLGETVGRMVRELRDWRSEWAAPERLEVVTAEVGITRFEALLRLAEHDPSPEGLACVQSLRYRIGALERLAGAVQPVLALERQWVHGDVNDGNLFFTGDRVSAVIDFDNLRQAPRGFDFMYGLNGCFEPGAPEQADYARAYLRLVRPPAAVVALYAPLWALRQICDIWPIDHRYLEPDTYDPGWGIPPAPVRWEQELDATTEWLLSQLAV
jgi:Ser/Thr protein kinase RdoA (MazF antagonist)